HRLNMVKMAIKDNSYFEVSDFEITQRVTSYTLNTVKYFKRLYSDDTLFFIIGIDSFLELPFWYKPEELLKMIDFIIMSRPGFNRIESSEFIEKKTK
ncbi:MAG: nicotinic acid mononucleotide adenylyltransferase, partial [Thermodesulfovibrionaceae bacterium]